MAKKTEQKAFEEILKSCFTDGQSDVISDLLRRSDLQTVDRLIGRAGLDGFLMDCCRKTGILDRLPEKLVQGMIQRQGLTMIKNETIRSHLHEVANQFKNANISFIAIKGIQMLSRIYQDYSDRSVTDIDILVLPEDYPTAAALLESIGFSYPEATMKSISEVFEKKWVEQEMREISYVRPAWPDPVQLDIHMFMEKFRNKKSMDLIFPTGSLDWFGHVIELPVDDSMIPCLDEEFELLHMIFHYSIGHSFMGHKWLVDICQMLQTKSDSLNWQKLCESCPNQNLRRLVSLTLSLCKSIGGPVLVPKEAYRYFPPANRSLAFFVARRIMFKSRSGIRGRFYLKFYQVLLPVRYRDRARVLKHYLFDKSSLKHRLGEKYNQLPSILFPFLLLKVTISEYLRGRKKQKAKTANYSRQDRS